MRLLIYALIFAIFIACSSKPNSGKRYSNINDSSITGFYSIVKNISNAKVYIYEIDEDGDLILKWTETTSNSSSLYKIGRFDAHRDELKDDRFYLYKAVGGKNWDMNTDGVKDSSPTTIYGSLRLVAKGSDIKKASHLYISNISEILYEKLAKFIKYGYDEDDFEEEINKKVKTILVEDTNDDGNIDILDLIELNPYSNKFFALNLVYQSNYSLYNKTIQYNGAILVNSSQIVSMIDTDDSAYSVAVSKDKNYAFVADLEEGLTILNISNKFKPKYIGGIDTDGEAKDVVLSPDEDYAFVADGSEGLQVIDISDKTDPTIVEHLSANDASRLFLSSDGLYLYLANGRGGVKIIDVSDPEDVSTESTISAGSGDSKDLFLSDDDDTLYIANTSNVKIVDVRDESNPKEYSSFDTNSTAFSVTVDKKEHLMFIGEDKVLEIVDIVDKKHPKLIKAISVPNKSTKVVYFEDIKKVLIANSFSGIGVVDVEDVTEAKYLGSIVTFGDTKSILLKNNALYVADGSEGFKIVDAFDAFSYYYVISRINIKSVMGVAHYDDKIYIADGGNGIYIASIEDDDNETKIESNLLTNSYVMDIKYRDDFAYLASYNQGLQIVDTIDYKNPRVISTLDTDGKAYSIALDENDKDYLFLADYNKGVKVIDISDKTHPVIVDSIDTEGKAIGITVKGNYAYLADSKEGLKIIDIKNKEDIAVIGECETDDEAQNVAVTDDEKYAFVADKKGDIRIIDISNKEDPYEIDYIETPGWSYDVKIWDNRLYVADGSGVAVFDISDINNIYWVAYATLNSWAMKIDIDKKNNRIYVSDLDAGVDIIDLNIFK